jgi:hypothetical protein
MVSVIYDLSENDREILIEYFKKDKYFINKFLLILKLCLTVQTVEKK